MKNNFGKISVGCFLIVLMLALPLGTTGCAQGSAPTRDELVVCEIAVLELTAGGTQLTPDERRQAAEAVDSAMRGNPEVTLRNYAIGSQALQRAASDRVYAAALRQALRFAVEKADSPPTGLEQAFSIERQIVCALDPTVVVDPKRSHIITESNLRDLYTASVWLAKKASLPDPSADFMDHLRAWLKANYTGVYDELAQALANEPQNFPLLPDRFNSVDLQQLQALRTKLEAADPLNRDVMLAGGVAIIANRAVHPSNGFLTLTTVRGINMYGPYSR